MMKVQTTGITLTTWTAKTTLVALKPRDVPVSIGVAGLFARCFCLGLVVLMPSPISSQPFFGLVAGVELHQLFVFSVVSTLVAIDLITGLHTSSLLWMYADCHEG